MAQGGVVDGQEGESVHVVHPHGMRVVLEEETVLLLALAQPQLGVLARGDVRPRSDHFVRIAWVRDENLLVPDPSIGAVLVAEPVLAHHRTLSQEGRNLGEDPVAILRMKAVRPPVRRSDFLR